MKVLVIAGVVHAAVSALRIALEGDGIQVVAWDDESDEYRNKVIETVQFFGENPDSSARERHEAWREKLIADGWVLGDSVDGDKKTHPMLVPYEELPPIQLAKDAIIPTLVAKLGAIKDADDAALELLELQGRLNDLQGVHNELLARTASGDFGTATKKEFTGIRVRYIGPRESWFDRLYGSGLGFIKGQVRGVTGDLARRFLKHGDLFEIAEAAEDDALDHQLDDDTDDILRQKKAEDEQREKRELDLNHLHYQVEQLDKAGLIEMGARYGVKLAKNATAEKVEEARAAIKGKIDQFGAV